MIMDIQFSELFGLIADEDRADHITSSKYSSHSKAVVTEVNSLLESEYIRKTYNLSNKTPLSAITKGGYWINQLWWDGEYIYQSIFDELDTREHFKEYFKSIGITEFGTIMSENRGPITIATRRLKITPKELIISCIILRSKCFSSHVF